VETEQILAEADQLEQSVTARYESGLLPLCAAHTELKQIRDKMTAQLRLAALARSKKGRANAG
jgi:hypothetical protein